MPANCTRLIDAGSVAAIVSAVGLPRLYDLAIERLETTLLDCTRGEVDLKERDGFVLDGPHRGLLEWMPAVRHRSTVAVKMVGYQPYNPVAHQLPTILSTTYVFEASSGHLRTVLDATFATAVRTGAASAIASRMMAPAGARVLGIVGCGAQAVTQVHALSRVLDIAEVLVHDIDPAAEAGFAARSRIAAGVVRVAPLAEIERGSDVICTATSVAPGAGPVLPGRDLREHVHVNAVGSDMPGKFELPYELLRRAVVCPDHRTQAIREGECQRLAQEDIGPSMFELIARPELAGGFRDVVSVYDSTGLAVQDLAMVELFEELAGELGVGHDMTLEASVGDPRDPYAFLERTSPWTLRARAHA